MSGPALDRADPEGATAQAAARCSNNRFEIAAVATGTWGFEVRPNEFDEAFQPLHQVVIPHLGLFIGQMRDLDALAEDCASGGRHAFWLAAAPIPVTGAVSAPVTPLAVK